jgi:hypothetical protein
MSGPPTSERAVRLRLFASAVALAAGVAALVVAILLVKSVIG